MPSAGAPGETSLATKGHTHLVSERRGLTYDSPESLHGSGTGISHYATSSGRRAFAASAPSRDGTVTIGGAPAPAGTVVTATVDGVEVGRVELARPGIMGDLESQCSQFLCLLVQSAISGGSTIRFFLNGVEALQTAPFDSGELT